LQVFLSDYPWAAGVATDLVNTAPGVWSGVDKLPDVTALTSFVTDHGVGNRSSAFGDADLGAVRDLRDQARVVIDRRDYDALVSGASTLTAGGGTPTLGNDHAGRPAWAVAAADDAPIARQLGLVCAVGILGVLQALGPERFRSCAAPTCSGVFIDSSRPGRRRYCMPGLCGNRVNVANHRARKAGSETAN
jgi:hypothetical protein